MVLVSKESEAASDCEHWNLPVSVQENLNADTVPSWLSSAGFRDTFIVVLSASALEVLARYYRGSYKPSEIGYERDWKIVLLQHDYDRFYFVTGRFVLLQQMMDRMIAPLPGPTVSQESLAVSLQNLQNRITQVQEELTLIPSLESRCKVEKVYLYLNYDKSILAVNFTKKPISQFKYQLKTGRRLLPYPKEYRGVLQPGAQKLMLPPEEVHAADVIFLLKLSSKISNELVIKDRGNLLGLSVGHAFSVPTQDAQARQAGTLPRVDLSQGSQHMQSVPRNSNP